MCRRHKTDQLSDSEDEVFNEEPSPATMCHSGEVVASSGGAVAVARRFTGFPHSSVPAGSFSNAAANEEARPELPPLDDFLGSFVSAPQTSQPSQMEASAPTAAAAPAAALPEQPSEAALNPLAPVGAMATHATVLDAPAALAATFEIDAMRVEANRLRGEVYSWLERYGQRYELEVRSDPLHGARQGRTAAQMLLQRLQLVSEGSDASNRYWLGWRRDASPEDLGLTFQQGALIALYQYNAVPIYRVLNLAARIAGEAGSNPMNGVQRLRDAAALLVRLPASTELWRGMSAVEASVWQQSKMLDAQTAVLACSLKHEVAVRFAVDGGSVVRVVRDDAVVAVRLPSTSTFEHEHEVLVVPTVGTYGVLHGAEELSVWCTTQTSAASAVVSEAGESQVGAASADSLCGAKRRMVDNDEDDSDSAEEGRSSSVSESGGLYSKHARGA